jgi:hypothetical protein
MEKWNANMMLTATSPIDTTADGDYWHHGKLALSIIYLFTTAAVADVSESASRRHVSDGIDYR